MNNHLIAIISLSLMFAAPDGFAAGKKTAAKKKTAPSRSPVMLEVPAVPSLGPETFEIPKERGEKRSDSSAKTELYEQQMKEDLAGPSAKLSAGAELIGSGKLFQTFEAIAKEYSLPVDILLTISLHESGFSMKSPKPSSNDKGWGLMGLGGKSNPNSLSEGAKALNCGAESLKTDPVKNIKASAALIVDLKKKVLGKKAKNMRFKDYHKILKAYAATGENFADQVFADEIFSILQTGYSQKMPSGEVITIEAYPELADFEPAPLQ
ncbi:MAG: transglycosylase SLT domain-containing protein [Elusimicrobia bacterium]|nr:transglycosylase SLT domain-containing protein [Elusimicrobiota bacterium]